MYNKVLLVVSQSVYHEVSCFVFMNYLVVLRLSVPQPSGSVERHVPKLC